MEKLVFKCYIKKADVKPDNSNLWYLPHHGVQLPSKTGKVTIVFNCSTNYEGTLLNHDLILGLDLTNHLIDILIRFTTEKMIFMGQIRPFFIRLKFLTVNEAS